jgi:hypothetical protein
MKRIKVLRELRGSVSKEPCPKLTGALNVLDRPAPGVKRGAFYSTAGVLLTAGVGDAKVFIPLAELFKLAEAADVRFSATPDSLSE